MADNVIFKPMETLNCRLEKQGLAPGSCLVKSEGKRQPACQATLKMAYLMANTDMRML